MSIPSKWQPRMPVQESTARPKTVSSSTKAFGVCTARFDNSHINDLPGPGYYDRSIDGKNSSMIMKSPSLSSKGLGNAFVSKTIQIEDREKHKAFIPGPGTYDSRKLPTVRSCPSFNRGSEGRHPFVMGPKTPGPNHYDINKYPEPGVSLLLQKKVSATFASSSKRESFLEDFSDAPGAGAYAATINAMTPNKTDYSWSKYVLMITCVVCWSVILT
jgi:hypothetical protein